ncbi:MAG: YdcF family protein [Deltaproteobacteria bacterium]|nr:YdcF family protein [Deltaproteobacteria bacterium]
MFIERIKKIKRVIVIAAFALIGIELVIALTPVANWLARPLIVGEAAPSKADIIAVLGGGAFKNGVLGHGSNERMIRGMLLYKQGRAPKIAFLGGSITNTSTKVFTTVSGSADSGANMDAFESKIMGKTAAELGIPADDIYIDAASTHTYSNITALDSIMRNNGMKSCLLVSSPTHMRRAMAIVSKLGVNCSASPVIDYTMHKDSVIGRIGLFYEVMWEYAGLVVYRMKGYI